jgi:heat shock protein HslJ
MVTFAVAVSGCSSAGASPQFTLAGTSWQLVSIQSMDNAQGTTTVPDPSKFTASFGEDGAVAFLIDCNRGNGTYEEQPSGDGVSGTLKFGPIATTLMACPQPSLDQRVSLALSSVRGYLIQDDRLHMSQEADGGILDWRRG